MDQVFGVFLNSLLDSLQPSTLDYCTTSLFGKNKQVSLYFLCRYSMVDAAIRSLFGCHLHDIEPNITKDVITFNDYAWQVFFQLPGVLGSAATEPKKRVIRALQTLVEIPEPQRPGVAWIVKSVLDEAMSIGLDVESRTSTLLLILWAWVANLCRQGTKTLS